MNPKTLLIPVVALTTAITIVISFTGCAGTAAQALKTPPPTHVVHLTGSGKKGGLVYDPLTGQASLGYMAIYMTLTTVPIYAYTDTNGVPHLLTPDVSESYEIAGKSFLFGAAGSTHTLATGNGVITQIGGEHQPINEGFYGTNNLMTYSQLQTASGATATASSLLTTITTATNGTVTATTNVINKPIIFPVPAN